MSLTPQEMQLIRSLAEKVARLEKRLIVQETIEPDAVITDHGALGGLSDDDHAQYALLAGRAGGQALSGGAANTDDLTINATAHATPTTSYLFLQTKSAGLVMIGSTNVPLAELHIHRTKNAGRTAFTITNNGTGNAQAGFRAAIDPADDTSNYVSMDVFGAGRSTSGLIEATGTIIEGNGGGNMIISSFSASKPMVFATGNSRTGRLWILPTGEVGIGASPTTGDALDVLQATLGNAVLRLASTATNDDPNETVYQDRVATTDATVTTLHTFTLANNTTYTFDVWVTARRTAGSGVGAANDGAGVHMNGAYKGMTGTATIVGTLSVVSSNLDTSMAAVTMDVTGATVRVRVTGTASNTIAWHMTARVRLVSS